MYGAENRLSTFRWDRGGIMRRTQRGVDVARARQAWRPVTLILAVAGAVILIGTGCSQTTSTTNIAAQSSGSGCPTQGVGGDTLAPPCVQPTVEPSSSTNGIPGPQSVPGSPAPTVSGPITVSTSPTGPSLSPPAAVVPVEVSPVVTGISPTSGTEVGGTSVTITGSGLTDTTVNFGGASATITANSA